MVVGAFPTIYNQRMDVFDFKRVMFEHYTGETSFFSNPYCCDHGRLMSGSNFDLSESIAE